MNNRTKSFLAFFLLFLIGYISYAQKNSQAPLRTTNNQSVVAPKTDIVVFNPSEGRKIQDADVIFKEVFNPSSKTSFQFISEELDKRGVIHKKWQQFYNNTKVEFAVAALHGKNNNVEFLTSEYYPIPNSFSTTPSILAEVAFQKALQHIGAQNYMWEYPKAAKEMDNYQKPTGELVILPVYQSNGLNSPMVLKLAYKFDMFATHPISRGDLYIDAQTNEVLFYNAIIKHASSFGFIGEKQIYVPTEEEFCASLENQTEYVPLVLGTAATRYSGTRSIETTFENPNYSLNDTTRGSGVFTRDALNQGTGGGTYPYVTNYDEFLDNDNNWTAAEWDNVAKDNAALDAHWGAMMTYDYWLTEHARNSYNGAGASIRSYVHVDVNYNNAFWNGSVMSYGDGSCVSEGCSGFDALTSIDVAAHEIGHAVTTFTSNLAYQRESGAMNEGFSDIWGAAVEYFAKGTGPDNDPNDEVWLIGDEIDRRTGSAALRSMSDPTSLGQPDTYGGTYWINPNCGTPTQGNDYCGVHTNSGVLNYWFYLLVEGGTGTNDIGSNYNVSSIGMADASEIAYATLLLLSSNSTFANARTLSIQATISAFGACSPEVESVTNAWYAVGVGAAYVNTCTPEISFATISGNTAEGSECGFTDIDVTLNIAIAASANADVSFSVNGSSTATSGVDFDLLTPSVTFPSGTTTPQTMTLRVYEDSFVEVDETAIIDFTVNANGGNAVADTSADTFTLTITNDDSAPLSSQLITVFSEGFESYSDFAITPVGGWTMEDNDGDATYGSTTYDYTNESYTGTFIVFNPSQTTPSSTGSTFDTHSGSKGYYCFDSTGNVSGNAENDDYIFSPQISLNGTGSELRFWAKSLTDAYGLERLRVGISTAATPTSGNTTIISPGPYLEVPITWTEYVYDLSAYDGQDIHVVFHVLSADAFAFMLDDISVTTTANSDIQIDVNTGTPDQMNISASGTAFSYDPTSDNIVLGISNNNTFDYGCTGVAVSRAGTGGQAYNGSSFPDLVMDKTFEITPTTTTGSGDTTITFYIEDAEIAGWETSVSPTYDRNDLVIARGNATSITEIAPLTTIGAFGTEVTLSGDFTGLNGTFYLGPASAFAPPCAGVTKTWDGNNWSPVGIPDGTNPVIINGNYNTNLDGNLDACSLLVNTGFTLTVDSDEYVKVENGITVDGSLVIEHEGNLVQVDSNALVDNNGTINVNVTTPNLRKRDFMLLGSPMTGELRTGVYNSSFMVLEFLPQNFMPHPDVPAGGTNWADDNGDFYRQLGVGTINPGEGYVVRPQSGYNDPTVPPAGRPFNFTYELGTLINGDVTYTNYNNGPSNPNGTPNVVANPYACAIDADLFLAQNPVGELYFWEHLTPPGTPLTGTNLRYDMNDISIYNGTMGIPAANDPGNTMGTAPNDVISSTQGFGIRTVGGTGTTGTITFNNGMRLTSGNTTLRTSNPISEKIILEVRENTYGYGGFMGVAFADNANEQVGKGKNTNRLATTVSLYSHLADGSGQLAIQTLDGFQIGTKIPIGFASQIDELLEYEISITDLDGINLNESTVYLWDNENNTITKLSDQPHTFKSMAGEFNERFVLLFSNKAYDVNKLNTTKSLSQEDIAIFPNPTNGKLNILTSNGLITKAILYDLQGREVLKKVENKNSIQLDLNNLQSSVYFVKIITSSGTITKRIVKK